MEFIEISAKNVDDAITQATVQLGITSDQLEYEVLDKGSTGFLGIGSKNAVIKARKKFSIDENVVEFLSSIFDAMKMEVEILVAVNEEEHIIEVELKGDDMGILIGKRGQTLDSLQYLTNLAINKHSDEYYKVKIDTEDYRKRRKETLENLAKNIAYKVKRTKRPVSLEPMNPFERRIIHLSLIHISEPTRLALISYAMAVSIGAALSAPQLVLYSLIAVGMAANKLGGAGGPLAVYFITIVASECGKIVSKETKVDILVTPAVTILVGVGLSVLCAPTIGAAASSVGDFIKWAFFNDTATTEIYT